VDDSLFFVMFDDSGTRNTWVLTLES